MGRYKILQTKKQCQFQVGLTAELYLEYSPGGSLEIRWCVTRRETEANRINNLHTKISDQQGQLLPLTKNSFIKRWKLSSLTTTHTQGHLRAHTGICVHKDSKRSQTQHDAVEERTEEWKSVCNVVENPAREQESYFKLMSRNNLSGSRHFSSELNVGCGKAFPSNVSTEAYICLTSWSFPQPGSVPRHEYIHRPGPASPEQSLWSA